MRKIVIEETKLDNVYILTTNNIEINIKTYLQGVILDTLDKVLTGMEDDKDDGEIQGLS